MLMRIPCNMMAWCETTSRMVRALALRGVFGRQQDRGCSGRFGIGTLVTLASCQQSEAIP